MPLRHALLMPMLIDAATMLPLRFRAEMPMPYAAYFRAMIFALPPLFTRHDAARHFRHRYTFCYCLLTHIDVIVAIFDIFSAASAFYLPLPCHLSFPRLSYAAH